MGSINELSGYEIMFSRVNSPWLPEVLSSAYRFIIGTCSSKEQPSLSSQRFADWLVVALNATHHVIMATNVHAPEVPIHRPHRWFLGGKILLQSVQEALLRWHVEPGPGAKFASISRDFKDSMSHLVQSRGALRKGDVLWDSGIANCPWRPSKATRRGRI